MCPSTFIVYLVCTASMDSPCITISNSLHFYQGSRSYLNTFFINKHCKAWVDEAIHHRIQNDKNPIWTVLRWTNQFSTGYTWIAKQNPWILWVCMSFLRHFLWCVPCMDNNLISIISNSGFRRSPSVHLKLIQLFSSSPYGQNFY